MKRFVSMFLVLAFLFGLLPYTTGNARATNASVQPVVQPRTEATEESGEDTDLEPETVITRAQWIQSLVFTFGMEVEEEATPDNYYSDLTGEEEYYRDILVATNFGVIDIAAGYPFCPNDPATREFAAHTLNFCLGIHLDEGCSHSFDEEEAVTYPQDIQVAIDREWFALSETAFLPEQPITKAEADFMLLDAAEVLATDTVDVNYTSTYSYAADVIEIPNGTEISVENNIIHITDCPTELVAGNIFVVYFSGIPAAYVADSVSVTDNITSVVATAINDGSAFDDIDAQGTVEAKFTDFVPAEGVEIIYINTADGEEYTDPEEAERAIERSRAIDGTYKAKRDISFKYTHKFSDAASATVSYKLKKPKVTYQIDLFDKTAKVYVEGNYDYSISASFDIMEMLGEDSVKLFFWGIPAVGGLSVEANFALGGSVTASESGKMKIGINYSKGSCHTLRSFTAKTFSISFEVSGKAGISVKFGITDIPKNVIDGYVYAEVGLAASVKRTDRTGATGPQVCVHAAAYLYAEYGLKASIGLTASSRLSFEDVGEIWNDENSPIRVVHHYEDGVEVPGCTCEDKPETNYYTPTTSNYWNTGWTKAQNSSSGYTSSGEPYKIYSYTVSGGNATITDYHGNANALTIPQTLDGYPVVAIGNYAFRGKTGLKSVTLPERLTTIGESAFRYCDNLETVHFPESLRTIGWFAFSETALTEVILPDGLTTLTMDAFNNCDSLEHVYIPKTITDCGHAFSGCDKLNSVSFAEGITYIPDGLFRYCDGLKSIDIPDTVTTIGSNAFQSCGNLTSVSFPEGLTSIGEYAFHSCNGLENITFPEGLTTIADQAFRDCHNLEGVHFPESLRVIGWFAFSGTPLKEVILPDGLTTLTMDAFNNCDSLEHVYIPKTITDCGHAFSGCDKLNSVSFAEGITYIPDGLFRYCDGLKSIDIPDTVTTIGSNAFQSCGNLTSVSFPEGLTSIGEYAFHSCNGLENITFPEGLTAIADQAFRDCRNLEGVHFPEGLRTIGWFAFSGTPLTEVVLPDGLTTLTMDAFNNCDSLEHVYIPKTITDCGHAFSGCDKLNSVSFAEGITYIPDGLFRYCDGLESVDIPDTVTTIGSNAFHSCGNLTSVSLSESLTTIKEYAFAGCGKLKDITLPESLTEVQNRAFENCTSLESVRIPTQLCTMGTYIFVGCTGLKSAQWDSVLTAIPSDIFHDCSSLQNFTVPDHITRIGDGAFYGCTAMETLNMGANVTEIGNYAFHNCKALKSITLPNRLKTIGRYAFYDCDTLKTVTIPDSVTTMGQDAFAYCDELSEVNLGTGLTEIANYSFYQCPKLTKIVIPYRVTSIGTKAFANCTSLTEVSIPRSVTSISTDAFSYASKLTIYGVAGTTAETYAANIGASFNGITKPATSITLSDTTLSLSKGASYQLSVSITPVDFTDAVAWKSSNTAVATVDAAGVVRAVGVGEAKISFVAGNKKATCTISVTQPVTSIYLNETNLSLEAGQTFTLTASVSPDNATNKAITWSSDNEAVATVDQNGVVTAYTRGTAIITATAQDGSGVTKTCTVTVLSNLYLVTDVEQLQSPHPHDADCNDIWQYTLSCAKRIFVTFSKETSVEEDCDYLHVYSADGTLVGTYTGMELAGVTLEIPGDTVKIKLVSDSSYCEYGFAVVSVTALEEDATHEYIYTDNGDGTHRVTCTNCELRKVADCVFENGKCVCGAVKANDPILNEKFKLNHSLNLASDISINYLVKIADLKDYDNCYLECALPVYEGNVLVRTETVTLQPEARGEYYYFVLDGLTAIQMNDSISAVLYAVKAGQSYYSSTDEYSVASYAYSQMDKANRPVKLKTLCADLLRYGAKAQIFKSYRLDALADGAMTDVHKAYLSDIAAVTFGNTDVTLNDLEKPAVKWVGKALNLESRVELKFVFNPSAYAGEVKDLALHVSYKDIEGNTKTAVITDPELYSAERGYYTFTFAGLLAAELRSVVSVQIFAGDVPVSCTLQYSADSYGSNRTGNLLALCKALLAYSDSAKAYFLF